VKIFREFSEITAPGPFGLFPKYPTDILGGAVICENINFTKFIFSQISNTI
jgi:hypothetical protein